MVSKSLLNEARDLSIGSVEIYYDQVLGIGSYGKVCKAKCGQLPCAAKLLHDTLFQDNDPGTSKLSDRFLQECQFLSTIKHPNIVQYLGTTSDPQNKRPILLMELMEENLTNFLEKLTKPLPYNAQLDICHDIALALAYLHSNAIIHRDLCSNNVLLIEGIRAKVTDLGMSKMISINSRKTPLTQVPGTAPYMPPEAIALPPCYTSKLDCFSHGVLTLQVITRNFPDPGDATTTVEDTALPAGRASVFIPKCDRRKKDIDLVDRSHPLLPTILDCLKDKDTERPSADVVCRRLALLKGEEIYTNAAKLARSVKLERLEQQGQIKELTDTIAEKEKIIQKILREREERVLEAKEEIQRLQVRNNTLEKELTDLKMKSIESEKNENDSPPLIDLQSSESKKSPGRLSISGSASEIFAGVYSRMVPEVFKPKWRTEECFPEEVTSIQGVAVVADDTLYVSCGRSVYSYMLQQNAWNKLTSHACSKFGMMVLIGSLTSIGGWHCIEEKSTNILYSLIRNSWEKNVFPPMPTKRMYPAVVYTSTHLVIAGGKLENQESPLSAVEVLNMKDSQWFSASQLPMAISHPEVVEYNGRIYCSEGNNMFSCSWENLLASSSKDSVWDILAKIPVSDDCSLTTSKECVLAVGGAEDPFGDNCTRAIHSYDVATDSWSVMDQMPTARSHALTALLPNNVLVVIGGYLSFGHPCSIVEIRR